MSYLHLIKGLGIESGHFNFFNIATCLRGFILPKVSLMFFLLQIIYQCSYYHLLKINTFTFFYNQCNKNILQLSRFQQPYKWVILSIHTPLHYVKIKILNILKYWEKKGIKDKLKDVTQKL